jgi:ADP-ribose pyrophosphatase YjhB (NUDIX family)
MAQELLVRALIIRDRKILVCQTAGRDYFFLPGGHVEFGETMQVALRREIREEIDAKITACSYIGSVENIFEQDSGKKHEVSFVFHVDIDVKDVISKEEHLSFYWATFEQFLTLKVLPPAMKDAIIAWTAEKEAFFVEEKTGNSN